MAYFSDLSEYSYIAQVCDSQSINIGWLDREHDFPKEEPKEEILGLLWEFCLFSVVQTRGLHECELCASPTIIVEGRDNVNLSLGSAEIRVFGENGEIYSAPNMIYHYVKEHNYKLPDTFVDALNCSPRPPSAEYLKKLKNIELRCTETLRASDEEPAFFSFKD
ncbi:DUF7919 family protein [Algicola sagamiensis]|uniref:DUF7919 family protein n=1 Tax=Algicola sagamiensis TaxID=163869 RepID=UPI00035F1B3A|nr:hypothetical protein [Algicola sagamiensis]